MILSFQSIWLILGKYDHLWFCVTGIWAPTFLLKVVTHKLYFSGVTAFSSLSAYLESRLKPPSNSNIYDTQPNILRLFGLMFNRAASSLLASSLCEKSNRSSSVNGVAVKLPLVFLSRTIKVELC